MNEEFWKEVEQLIKPIPELNLEYRLYYNELGAITSCSMIDHAEGDYIIVTKQEYDNYFQYTIVDGKLKPIDTGAKSSVKLKRSTAGFPVVKGHAGILLESGENVTDIEYYARNN